MTATIGTRDGTFWISLEGKGEGGRLLIHRQGASGQALVQAMTAEQAVEIVLGIDYSDEPAVPEELKRVLEEQKLEIKTSGPSGRRAEVSRHAEYKDSRTSRILRPAYASGQTKGDAVRKLVERLSGKLLVLDAYGSNRLEIQMPEFDPGKGDTPQG